MRGGSVRGRSFALFNTEPAGGGGTNIYYLGGLWDNRAIRGLGWISQFLLAVIYAVH